MLGFFKALGALKHIAKVVPVIKACIGAQDELAELLASFKRKLDTDKDGVTDFTKKEALEFAGEALVVVLKRLSAVPAQAGLEVGRTPDGD